jgi:hypothetical protein
VKPYFYVYRPQYGAPFVRHATIQEAQAEAERLAVKHPGITFEILASVGLTSTTAQPPSTFWMDGVSIKQP